MFPVKGLSISAEKLKVETETSAASAPSAPKPSKKRKRHGNSENVTAANLADLWEKVIEHKGPAKPGTKPQPKQDNKRQKTEHGTAASSSSPGKQDGAQLESKPQQSRPDGKSEKKKNKDKRKEKKYEAAPGPAPKPVDEDHDEWNGLGDEEQPSEAVEPVKEERADNKKKKRKQQDDTAGAKGSEKDSRDKKDATTALPSPPPAPTTAKLTPLQASMREKLISARFRHLNETLYTRPSAEAFQLFEDSPEMFAEYHEGFRRQVDVWPENPVDIYISDIKARARVRFAPRNRNHQPLLPAQLPLPKAADAKTTTIADLGCGDAKLAAALEPVKAKLRVDVKSFDLQTGGSPLVTRADVANLPLADGSVDVAIFCLALMGTNWLDFVEEAYRVLRWKGELWVAEIKSRFAAAPPSSKAAVAHSVGNRTKTDRPLPASKKKHKSASAKEEEEQQEAADLADLAIHVDGAAVNGKQQHETDISAFVETLRKRGFLLNRDLGENAVDMSNKMFVRMNFVKAAPAVKGKCAVAAAEGGGGWGKGKGGGKDGSGMAKKKFLEGDGDRDEVDEAKVLKPCVYKLR